MKNLKDKKILLIICGGIAAYKSLETIRILKKNGCEIKTILTKSSKEFVTPLSIASLSQGKVYDDLFSIESVKYLYTQTKNKFAIVADDKLNIYLAKISSVIDTNISKNSKNYSEYEIKAYDKMIDSIYNSYDIYLNKKYKVKINEKTLERVKNYFQ